MKFLQFFTKVLEQNAIVSQAPPQQPATTVGRHRKSEAAASSAVKEDAPGEIAVPDGQSENEGSEKGKEKTDKTGQKQTEETEETDKADQKSQKQIANEKAAAKKAAKNGQIG